MRAVAEIVVAAVVAVVVVVVVVLVDAVLCGSRKECRM